MKTEKIPWDVVVVGAGWGCEGKGKLRRTTCFSSGMHGIRYAFIISRTFVRGRYSLIVSNLIRRQMGCGLRGRGEVA